MEPPTNFHPDLIATYGRGAFFYSAHCSFSNPICFWSVWCWRTMIPGKIITGFARFQGIVNVSVFWFPIWLQELFASSFVFPEKYLFCTDMTGSIGWPSPAPRLHIDDCFEIYNFHWELCDLLLSSHQNFLHELRLRQCVVCTGLLWLWSFYRSRNFGLSGSEYKHCVYPNPHFSQAWALMMVHEMTGVWVSAFRNSIIHEILFEFLQPFRYFGTQRVAPFYIVVTVFIWFLDLGLSWLTLLPVLSFEHVHLTQIRDRNLSHTGLPLL